MARCGKWVPYIEPVPKRAKYRITLDSMFLVKYLASKKAAVNAVKRMSNKQILIARIEKLP